MNLTYCRNRDGDGRFFSRGKQSDLKASFAKVAAFTMIEIAISLAVIAFALVAIIGVLPTGMTVQKDNREETIVNQDGPYLLEAIRSGAKGLDSLTNYVEQIGIVLIDLSTNASTLSTNFDYFDQPVNKTGSNIVGLLSIPKWSLYFDGSTTQLVQRVEAKVRALTGAATEQGLANTDLAFTYLLTSEIVPFANVPEDSTNYAIYSPGTVDYLTRSNRYVQVGILRTHTHEARLAFRWPFISLGRTGPNRQIFRSLVSGQLAPAPAGPPLFFFQPQTYAKP